MQDNDQIHLFHGASLAAYLAEQLLSAHSLVEQITPQQFLTTGADTLVRQIVEQLSIAPLVLDMDQMQRQQSDSKISKEVDATDYGMPVRREVMVRGYKMPYAIPFSGDPSQSQHQRQPFV